MLKSHADEKEKEKEKDMSSTTFEKKKSAPNGVIRVVITAIAAVIEVAVVILLLLIGNYYLRYLTVVLTILAVILTLIIYSSPKPATIKMPWLIFILSFPAFGLIMYLFAGLSGSVMGARKRYKAVNEKLGEFRKKNDETLADLRQKDPSSAGIASYLQNRLGFSIYDNSDITYFGETTDCLDDMIAHLNEAKEFIFMEYFAIEDSDAFHRVLEVLERKVKEGVEVRVFYDDLGSIGFIGFSFAKKLTALGIECRVFNPFSIFANFLLNNRDHRKIMVIDGKVGYTGGFNMADEYFHLTEPYGHWFDGAVRIEGEAVRSLTLIFLENWTAHKLAKREEEEADWSKYLPEVTYEAKEKCYIQPYSDSPGDDDRTGENVYLNIANTSKEYLYISTPYLIITDEMVSALTLASKRGVDVRILTPGIPDKKMVYSITRSYYYMLCRDGVRIYEYTPGFNHAKLCVSDDVVATCGTINFDYRSLYHNFEDGCIFYYSEEVKKERDNLLELFGQSEEVTEKYAVKRAAILRAGQMLLRLIAPLL